MYHLFIKFYTLLFLTLSIFIIESIIKIDRLSNNVTIGYRISRKKTIFLQMINTSNIITIYYFFIKLYTLLFLTLSVFIIDSIISHLTDPQQRHCTHHSYRFLPFSLQSFLATTKNPISTPTIRSLPPTSTSSFILPQRSAGPYRTSAITYVHKDKFFSYIYTAVLIIIYLCIIHSVLLFFIFSHSTYIT